MWHGGKMVSFVLTYLFMSLLLTAWMFLCGSTEFIVVSEILSCKQMHCVNYCLVPTCVYLVHKAFWKLFRFTHLKARYCRVLYSCIHAVHINWTEIQRLFCSWQVTVCPLVASNWNWNWQKTEIIQHYETKRVYFPVFYNVRLPQVETRHDTNS